jgi:hypothetical protein
MNENVPTLSKSDISALAWTFSNLIKDKIVPYEQSIDATKKQIKSLLRASSNYTDFIEEGRTGRLPYSSYTNNSSIARAFWERHKELMKDRVKVLEGSIKQQKMLLKEQNERYGPALSILKRYETEFPNNFNPPEYIHSNNENTNNNSRRTATRGGKKKRLARTRKNRK